MPGDDFTIFDLPARLVEGPHCAGCLQQPVGERLVRPDGRGTSKIMLVGDSPWKDEIKAGKPFAGAAGQFLDRHIFGRLGVRREDFLLTNAMWCKPPALNWTDHASPEAMAALDHCSPYLDELIAMAKPKVIMALGNVAMRRLLGFGGIQKQQAYVHESSKYGVVIPTFHPSFLMQDNHKYTPAMYFAFRRAQQIVKEGEFKRLPVEYSLDETPDRIYAYMTKHGYSPELPLAVDIETPRSHEVPEDERDEEDDDAVGQTIIRAGFSWSPGSAVSFQWQEPYISLLERILQVQAVVVFHNKNFDLTRLQANGILVSGRIYDTMWMWHFLQSDLPKSLEFITPFHTDLAPWKHLASAEPAFYNAVDNDATIRLYYALKQWLEKQGRFERFERHCVDADRKLAAMGRAGVLVDRQARDRLQASLQEEVQRLEGEIQRLVPDRILPKKIYKTDRVIRTMTPEEQAQWIPYEAACDCSSQPDGTSTKLCRKCKGSRSVTYWKTSLQFNFNSSDQVKALVLAKGLKVPIKRGENREAVEAKNLKQFGKKHPVFQRILEARQHSKMISTYDWPLDPTGRVHTTYGFHPSTWRKSSRSVNLQNIPKRSELAHLFRQTLVASPGHLLVTGDSAAIEAVLVGYAARSPRYIAAAKAGIHDLFMSHVRARREGGSGIDPQLPYGELVTACREAKEEDARRPLGEQIREACKRTIHGSNYGLTPYGMNDEYPDLFPKRKDAQEMQEMYLGLYREIRPWMRETHQRASSQTFLDNHYQYRHYFFSVYKWNSTHQTWELGEDAKRAVAFVPQADASAIQTEDLLTLSETWLGPCLRLIIHDEFVLEVPYELWQEACQLLYEVQSRPRPELGGLSIGSEVKYGPNLADLTQYIPTLGEQHGQQ